MTERNDIARMVALADSLEQEDRRAIIIQIWDGEIKGASELVVKALRAYVASSSSLTSKDAR